LLVIKKYFGIDDGIGNLLEHLSLSKGKDNFLVLGRDVSNLLDILLRCKWVSNIIFRSTKAPFSSGGPKFSSVISTRILPWILDKICLQNILQGRC
jgi:hypothetical protein